jgi:hypothetical protein
MTKTYRIAFTLRAETGDVPLARKRRTAPNRSPKVGGSRNLLPSLADLNRQFAQDIVRAVNGDTSPLGTAERVSYEIRSWLADLGGAVSDLAVEEVRS